MEKTKRVSLSFYPNLQKKRKKTGRIPVYLKLTFNGKKVEYRLPEQFDFDENTLLLWDAGLMQVRKNPCEVNSYLNKLKSRFDSYLTNNNFCLKHNLAFLLEFILERTQLEQNQNVGEYCTIFLQQHIEPSNELALGTKKNYRNAVEHFSNYLKNNGLSNLPLREFKYQHSYAFKSYLSSGDVNLSPVSCSSNIRRIKRIFKEAYRAELIDREPFTGIKITYKSGKKTPFLPTEYIKRIIYSEKLQGRPELILSRDLFLFGIFTGLSCVDYRLLKKNSLYPVLDGRVKLDTCRQKTKKQIIQILTKPAQMIAEKYIAFTRVDNDYIFPTITNETINKNLKVIAAMTDIPLNLSTKMSRTTCNHLIINSGNWDQVYKRIFMGWSNESAIELDYTTIVDETLLMHTKRLENHLFTTIGETLLLNL